MRTLILLLCVITLTACAGKSTYSENAIQETLAIPEWNNAEQIENDEIQEISYLADLIDLPQLEMLIETTLANNPSLQQQIIAAQMLIAQSEIARSVRIPSAQLTASQQESLESSQLGAYSGSLEIGWAIDIWGKFRDIDLATQQEVLAGQANLQAFQDTLIAQVMQTYIAWRNDLQLLHIEQQYLQLLKKDEEIIKQRYRNGLGTLADLDLAESNRLLVEASIVALEERINIYVRQLSTLSGQSSLILEAESEPLQVILPLADLPSQTLARRPDLQAAYHAIQADEYTARATYKNMLPSLNLQALLSSSASTPADVLSGSFVWSLLGNLTAPLFQGGRLQSEAELADMQVELSYYAYKEILLKAVEEVSNALGQEESLSEQEIFLAESYESALRSTQSYEQKYRDGLIDILDLLAVQKTTFDIERSLIQIRTARLNNRISLGLALGLGVEYVR